MLAKETISRSEFTLMVFAYLMGTSFLVPPGIAAKKDAWMAIVLLTLWSALLGFIYSQLNKQFPRKTLIEYLKLTFGKFIGSFLGFLYLFHFIFLSSLLVKNINDFLLSTAFGQTPQSVIGLSVIIAITYTLRKGFRVVGLITQIVAPLIILQITTSMFASAPRMEPSYILPMLENGFKPVVKGLIQGSGWPYGEIISFAMIFPILTNNKKVFSMVFKAIALASVMFIMIFLRNLSVLGENISIITFPSLAVFELIELPGLGHVDLFIMMVFLAGVTIKIWVNFYAAALALQELINLKDYKVVLFPLGIVIVFLANIVYSSYSETMSFGVELYPYYLFPLSFVIPLIVLISTKFKEFNNTQNSTS